MENIKGLSFDEAIICHYLIALDKWIWITNTTFPSSSRELFTVGDLLLGPRGWDAVQVWEEHRVWKQIPLLWDATWELCRRKDNQLQECLVSTKCWKKKFLHLSRMPVNTCPWGLRCEGEPSGKAGASSELFMGQVDWRADGHRGRGGPRPSATCQIEGQRQVDVKLGTIFPPSAPSLLDLFTHEWSIKAEGLVAWGGLRA